MSLCRRIINWLTQKSVVGLSSEKLLHTVKVESEWQKDFDVRSLRQNLIVGFASVLQVRHANGVVSLLITNSIKWIHDLRDNRQIKFLPFTCLMRFKRVVDDVITDFDLSVKLSHKMALFETYQGEEVFFEYTWVCDEIIFFLCRKLHDLQNENF